ncbi:heme ABC exporter ATP-binding protein CcmA [Gammaproteobacteria bacterium]|nr:heme ABC exporter ATP-binding protein CcmA [Gammaproteobacteria bacterium]
MNPTVTAQNLSYKINDKKLFQSISFDLLKGNALHVRGENGSGKTTLLRMVCGLTKPSKGDLIVKTDKDICFIGHKNALKQYLSIEDNLILMSLDNHKKLDHYLKIFGLDQSLDINIANLSFGQQKKIALLRLFLNDSDLLVLDEPCVGLDHNSQETLVDFLKKELKEQKAILYSSHIKLDFVSDTLNI